MTNAKATPKSPKTTYCLTLAVLGPSPTIPIAKARYDELLNVWECIGTMLDIEESWNDLIQNYSELEVELLTAGVTTMISDVQGYDEFIDIRSRLSRRVFNLLQACRAYLDYTDHQLGKFKFADIRTPFNTRRHEAYDNDFGYRFMEALRNYSQHQGVPMHSLSLSSRWLPRGEELKDLMRNSATGKVSLEKLRSSGFKKAVLDEVPNEKFLDITDLTRAYLEGLWTVHDTIRVLVKDHIKSCRLTIQAAVEEYGKINNGKVLGLAAAAMRPDGTMQSHTNIFEDIPNRLDRLSRRNRSLVNLRRRYVSNEILGSKA